MKLLILGANGFIGSHLSEYILRHRPDWHITAMDLSDRHLSECLGHKQFHFTRGDITKHKDWIEAQVKVCDVVLPLVAIANPATYVKNPLAVFELDFEANLEIVRLCVRHKKRIVFPSTSEVYGISPDIPYDEESSMLATGPIAKERWIYSCSKQMLDRVIYAYGSHHGLDFTLFRPFNWFGPRLDNVWEEGKASRVVSQFLSNIVHKRDIVLVGGGGQKRCFLYVDDAIEALVRIIDNKDGCARGRIFNIGDPENEASIKELAEMMLEIVDASPGYKGIRAQINITAAKGEEHYGQGYQDVQRRVPKIGNAAKWLDWKPKTSLRNGIEKTIAYYLAQALRK
ncbi:MAG: bifunctional UDP-4-keto-pentose/UDP-xylose synthase [Pseudomonadota bacterium]|nr:bifunctional UDP-4-keto-pentose/UDP-xylose synthase [Pseudomonadota bacterium]